MSTHPLNPDPGLETPRPDPADPLANPPPLPGHAPQGLPERAPAEMPRIDPDVPVTPDSPPVHPLGPPAPQPRH